MTMPAVPGGGARSWTAPARRPGRAAAGATSFVSASSPPEVAISTVPTTRSPNSSGYGSANAMMVMPPIECPTSTSGPSGAVRSITRRSGVPERGEVVLAGLQPAGPAVPRLVVRDDPVVAPLGEQPGAGSGTSPCPGRSRARAPPSDAPAPAGSARPPRRGCRCRPAAPAGTPRRTAARRTPRRAYGSAGSALSRRTRARSVATPAASPAAATPTAAPTTPATLPAAVRGRGHPERG